MSVTVDHQPLAAEELGLQTVGELFAHLQKDKRLVVHVLIDGLVPEPGFLAAVRHKPLTSHTLFIETADSRALAIDALKTVEEQLGEADRLRGEASELLQKNLNVKAMEKLSGCLCTWKHAQESVQKTAQLLKIDLQELKVQGRPLSVLVFEFGEQLRQIKGALENRDFVLLNDLLTFETTQTSDNWRAALKALRAVV